MSATELAQNIADFIKHNNIDLSVYSMDQVVQAYFNRQLAAIDDAGIRALGFLGANREAR